MCYFCKRNEVDFYGSTCNEVDLRVSFVNVTKYRHRAFYFFLCLIIPLHTETAYTLHPESPRLNP